MDASEQRKSDGILKLAFATAALMYVGLCWFMHSQGTQKYPGDPGLVKHMGQALAAVFAVNVFLVAPRVRNNRGGFILKMALYESGAIFGLLLFFLSGELMYVMGFSAVAFLLILWLPLPSSPSDR